MRIHAAASSLVLATLLAACGGSDGGSSGGGNTGVVPTPTPVTPTPTTPTPTTPAPTTPTPTTPTPSPTSGPLALTGALSPAHDPTMLRDGDTFFLFNTGNQGDSAGLLPLRTSTDLRDWTLRGAVFRQIPAWATAAVPGTAGIWAPDIIKVGSEYRLYYSVSTFGRNDSAIGLTTSTSINPSAPDGGWTDKGVAVVESQTSDNFNAIDPAVFIDAEGRHWMAFGSFWTGIKLIQLDPATGLRLAGDTLRSIASRPFPGAIEAPYIVRRNNFYYLFASFEACCQGSSSTYYTVVGRSTSPAGPYVDREGRAMMEGGGTVILTNGQTDGSRFVGRGHVTTITWSGQDYIVYHAYDRQRNGIPTLQIQPLGWTADGWPEAQ